MVTANEYQGTGMSCGLYEAAIRTDVSQIDGLSGIDGRREQL
ncbi:hypothetical protein [Nesterenkonia natronophila]|nr:hypothetical protein [Nesterenkonia natronophila]